MRKRIIPSFALDGMSIHAIRQAVRDVVTQSEIMTRASCPRKWFYRYALRLERRGLPNLHLIYGTMMHAALRELYATKQYGEPYKEAYIEVPNIHIPESMLLMPGAREDIEFTRQKVQIAFDAYRRHYYKEDRKMRIVSTEKDYVVDWKGIQLQGRIDLVAYPRARDALFIWDFKTAGRFDATMLDVWSFRFQFLFYAWLYWKATGRKPAGIIANGLAKTLLRPSIINRKTKEKESKEMYLYRVRADMFENREKHFYRQRMPMPTGQLERFEVDILQPHIDSFSILGSNQTNPVTVRSLAMSMNTGACHAYNSFCEFLPLCKDGPLMLAEYDRREVKHAELMTAENESEIGES